MITSKLAFSSGQTSSADLSIVVTARNDNHGGNLLRRMQIFVNGLLAQSERHKLKTELILVEWNPPSDKPRLAQVLSWPEKHDFCTVRIIEIPPEIHRRYKYANKLPLYQMIAKNVGIRRARGKFILATNIDLLFSDELIKFLASGDLMENRVYRVDRYDVSENIPLDAAIDEQLEYCYQNIIRVNRREGTHNLLTGWYFAGYSDLHIALTNLHFNACGDFTLMSKKDWYTLRGYPEFDMYSPHLDSLLLLIAYHTGIRQEILQDPMRIYHIEHSGAWIAEKASRLERETKSADIPVLGLSQLEEWATEMNRNGRPIIFNKEGWGLVSDSLRETIVVAAAWERLSVKRESEESNIASTGYMFDTQIDRGEVKHLISVVIVTEKGTEFLKNCLDSLVSQKLSGSEYEVLIVTDGSKATEEIAEGYKDKINIKYINGEYKGLSSAWKTGVKKAKGDIVLFLNGGDVANENLLSSHMDFHKLNTEENIVMLGRREWDGNLKGSPMMEYMLRDYGELRDGDVIGWYYFRCNNLSCKRDFLLRYGNFDEIFEEHGDIELGYRLSRHDLKIIHNNRAKTYKTNPLGFKDFCEGSFSEGRFTYAFDLKHPDSEVREWCGLNDATVRLDKIEGEMPRYLSCVESLCALTPSISECYDRIFEYHRLKGAVSAEREKAKIIKKIFSTKLCEKAKLPGEKTILIVSKHVPLLDKDSEDNRLYQMIKVLARYHRVVFLARQGVEKGKYVEELRKLGVIVFYDAERLRQQAQREPVTAKYAGIVNLMDLFTHINFDLIILDSKIAGPYIYPVREFSPQSAVVINTHEVRFGTGYDKLRELYTYEQADVVIAANKTPLPSPIKIDLNIVLLPETPSDNAFEKKLLQILDELPEPKDRDPERFRVFPESLPAEFSSLKTELTVIFVAKDLSQASRLSMESIFNNTDQQLSKTIVALHNRTGDKISNKLEKESRLYFKFDNEQELNAFYTRIVKQCGSSYVAVVASGVIVPPYWDMRLVAHLKRDSKIGIITPITTKASHDSLYEFESDAWDLYEKHTGANVPIKKVDVPCIAFNCSAVKKIQYHDIAELTSKIIGKGYKMAKAKDTFAWHLGHGLKNKNDRFTFKNPETKLLSVVVPSYNSKEKLLKCLESLFNQKNVDFGELEAIVVDDGSEDRTIEALSRIKAPCEFRYYEQPLKGRSAAMNLGIKEASGKFILIVSPYASACENLLSEHLKTHDEHSGEDIAVVGHISCTPLRETAPFMKFLLKNPKILWNNEFAYKFADIEYAENAGYHKFYTPNISLKRDIFKKVGFFDESLNYGCQDSDFGLRFSLRGYRIVYNRNAVIDYYYNMDLEKFLKRQLLFGREYAIKSQKHPGVIDPDRMKMECLRHLFGKEKLVECAKRIVNELEGMPDDIRNNYKYARASLLEKCYIILANYYSSKGINEVMCELEGNNWLHRFIKKKGWVPEDIMKKSKAYELLIYSYLNAGMGDFSASFKNINHAAKLVPMSPSIYYAFGNLHMNLGNYKLAESALMRGFEKRETYNSESVFPAENEVPYYLWLAMACIPQGNYKKAAKVLEDLIGERRPLSIEQGAFIYKSLSLCYHVLGEERKAFFCKEESERLKEEERITQDFPN